VVLKPTISLDPVNLVSSDEVEKKVDFSRLKSKRKKIKKKAEIWRKFFFDFSRLKSTFFKKFDFSRLKSKS